ncbi:thiamine phosphate synthase [Brumimicrobium glaciale]|uniref:Thiamine phosphate synthase n=1 Tax=Brumimicrobium glaciale TaxID=200475 RepID=A0A4Q4KME6_9FLAO|nr:thiamine phosphate synthase [Brumimicrobium glaciale]RYM33069.1 thiamine phosphate synthase [Brumimicrobium glaciale]
MESNKNTKNIGGLYLVLDPSIEQVTLLTKLKSAIEGGVDILQIWNNWPNTFRKIAKINLINLVVDIAKQYNVPVLINEEWELVIETELSGIHFDIVPSSLELLKSEIDRELIIGVTCSNSLEIIEWAQENKLDYISFCSLFPSKSAGLCEIVTHETILKARRITRIPLFVSGGITSDNLLQLQNLGISGVAVISGVLDSPSPKLASQKYIQTLNKIIQ